MEPLLGIWGSEALERLEVSVGSDNIVEQKLGRVVEEMQGKSVKPLREEVVMMTWKKLRGGG